MMDMTKSAAIAAIAVLASWSGAQAQNAADKPVRGGTLVYSVFSGEPSTYDCHAAPSAAEIHRIAPHYSTLLRISQASYPNVVGDAAESWKVSPDGLTYEFKLRPNIQFHDGAILTSADVKATYERIRKPPQGIASLRQSQFGDVASIETPDGSTVVFKLSKPNATMLTLFASPFNCLYQARRIEAEPNFFARNIMGSGPFRFSAHLAGAEWRGVRFENYFRPRLPYLDGYTVINLDPSALANSLIAGRIQIDFRGMSPADADRIMEARGPAMKRYESDSPGALMLAFNTERAPFNDVRVRQAMNLAIDRWTGAEAIGRLNLFSVVNPFQRIGSTWGRTKEEVQKLPGFRPDMNANRAEARRLLAEAGQPNLKGVFTNRAQYSALGIFLIDQWRQIGATITQEQPDNAAYAAATRSGGFDMIGAAIPDQIDEPTIQLANITSFDINPNNPTRVIDRTLDELFERQLREPNAAQRKAVIQQMEDRLLSQAYIIPLYWAKRIVVGAAEVRGFDMSPSALISQDLAEIWLAPK